MTIRREIYEKHVVGVAEGRVIFNEGDEGTQMFVIIDGEIEIVKRTSLETSKTLTTLKKGDVFGEMALIDAMPRSATAIAKKNGKLLVMDEALFYSLAKNNADFSFKMIKVLSERIRKSNETISKLASENRDVRTLKGLAEYGAEQGKPSVHGLRIERLAFARWAEHHLGLRSAEVQAAVDALIAKKAVQPGAVAGEVLLPRRISTE
ncbi:MAG: Crp/Fnr family transcriptional regulator [Treponemataceae bacterium]